ncbi:T9SS type A sorting domain-containing protein [Mangrovibacterium lignilyticum]|uniref:T9SS type A sorting domain-containing protein n=1 Tax=Mangrovibacterium lignilyticum TaxID=2668052 RepID=UPI0013D4192D|nr:T9SS type A sorting domain-containing protein [Mangrovibacterium lignilyticum]
MAQNRKADLLVTGNAGGTLKSTSYTIDFTVGETITEAFQTETVMLTQGFHQATAESTSTDQGIVDGSDITTDGQDIVSSIEEEDFMDDELNVYPNPFKSKLSIDYSFDQSLAMDISIFDIAGKVVLNFAQTFDQGTQQLDLSSYPKGIYFIKFFNQENQKLRTFKIIKS